MERFQGEEKDGMSSQAWILCVFGGWSLESMLSLMAEENCWQCEDWTSSSTGYMYIIDSHTVQPCHDGQGGCNICLQQGLAVVWLLD